MHIKATEKQRNVIRSVAMAKDGDDGNTWSAEIAKAKTAEPYPAKETNCLVSTAEAKQRSELRWNSKAGIALQWRGAESRTTQWHSKSWFGEAKAKSIKAQFSSAERR